MGLASGNYESAIPILTRHLRSIDDPYVKADIAGLLATPSARISAWDAVVAEYRRAPADGSPAKTALGHTLAILADRSRISVLLELVQDLAHGFDRAVLITHGLGKFRDESLVAVFESLLADEKVTIAALEALAKRGSLESLHHIVPLFEHRDSNVADEARRAATRIERRHRVREARFGAPADLPRHLA